MQNICRRRKEYGHTWHRITLLRPCLNNTKLKLWLHNLVDRKCQMVSGSAPVVLSGRIHWKERLRGSLPGGGALKRRMMMGLTIHTVLWRRWAHWCCGFVHSSSVSTLWYCNTCTFATSFGYFQWSIFRNQRVGYVMTVRGMLRQTSLLESRSSHCT